MYLVYTGRGVVVKSGGAGSYISHRAALQSCHTTPREHSKNFKTSRRVGRLVISALQYFEQSVSPSAGSIPPPNFNPAPVSLRYRSPVEIAS